MRKADTFFVWTSFGLILCGMWVAVLAALLFQPKDLAEMHIGGIAGSIMAVGILGIVLGSRDMLDQIFTLRGRP